MARASSRTPVKTEKVTSARRAPSSVVLQARVEPALAEQLLADAVILGLDGPSELVREGLRLVHRRAQEQAMVAEYEEFYGTDRAPLPVGVAATNAR